MSQKFEETFGETLDEIDDVAIVGMSIRVPGAKNLEEFWQLLREGREGMRELSEEEVAGAGVSEAERSSPRYVRRAGFLDDIEQFDASFFDFSAREAEMLDPQQRLFLESAWEALESSGHDPGRFDGRIGVFAGSGLSAYLAQVIAAQQGAPGGLLPAIIANDKDHLATRVSYKLNLRGPSIAVQTACSTSLVAVHQAWLSLRTYQSDMALAGGVSIRVPQQAGYLYEEGSVLSPDGRCRPFDAKAAGTVFGSGVGVVVLRRLEDARRDGDVIHAVIKGSAINNDGADKVGYTAPCLARQAEVISEALAVAGVDPHTVGYVEAHGTGTSLGDPIEMAALVEAFGPGEAGSCAVGSVKGNIGHLDAASGVAGLIKAALIVSKGELVPSVHFESLNPRIELRGSPFHVNGQLRPWPTAGVRRAGVSSFGIGGTNAHVVLEEPPRRERPVTSERSEILYLSGRTETAVDRATELLADALESSGLEPGPVAYTLQERRAFRRRRAVVVKGGAREAADTLRQRRGQPVGEAPETAAPVLWVFPGQGSQLAGMGRELYDTEEVFRAAVVSCAEVLDAELGFDVREALWGDRTAQLGETWLTQPALFTVQLAAARQWSAWGVNPAAMVGHSLGEWVAACVAGVFSLETGLRLVAGRARAMQACAPGMMLAVSVAEEKLSPLLPADVELSAVNGPEQCVVGGALEAIDELARALEAQGIGAQPLDTSHAFHTRSMAPARAALFAALSRETLRAPSVPLVSTVTGDWLTDAEATSPSYWADQLLAPVRFGAALETLARGQRDALWLEMGPRQALRRPMRAAAGTAPVICAGKLTAATSERAALLEAAGALWEAGVPVRPSAPCPRVQLPSYPFERRRYWIDARSRADGSPWRELVKQPDHRAWLYTPEWKRLGAPGPTAGGSWLVFEEPGGVELADELSRSGRRAWRVRPGRAYAHDAGSDAFEVVPGSRDDLERLWAALGADGDELSGIACCWGPSAGTDPVDGEQALRRSQELLALVQSLPPSERTRAIALVTVGAHEVTGAEELHPVAALLGGFSAVLEQELSGVRALHLDLESTDLSPALRRSLVRELVRTDGPSTVAFRGRARWTPTYEPLAAQPARPSVLRDRGVYLITGGLGGIGLAIAEHLAAAVKARLVLVGRSGDGQLGEPARAALDRIAASGAETMIGAADVAVPAELAEVIRRAEERFGPLDGVIHAAGLRSDSALCPLDGAALPELERQFRAKVDGILALEEVLAGVPLDFCALCSSLATILGGIGLGAYAAANRFMETFVRARNRGRELAWQIIDWDAWRPAELAPSVPAQLGQRWELAMTREEGARVFATSVAFDELAQVVVSTVDLARRRALDASDEGKRKVQRAARSLHPRPMLLTAYAPARDEMERALVDLVENLVGVSPVGIEDDFFELGGDSLMATQFLAYLRGRFGAATPSIAELLAAGSIARMVPLFSGQEARPALEPPEELDPARDVGLRDTFVLGTRAARPPGSPRVVLLTGATGFLGSFLLRELLTRTDADVLCLVRAANVEAGRQRIVDALSGWARHVESRPERIAPLLGELSEPAFGLGEEEFCRLAAAVDAVYHNGALVNFVYPYTRLRATNIEGTHEVLRFAARHCTPVHFVFDHRRLLLGRRGDRRPHQRDARTGGVRRALRRLRCHQVGRRAERGARGTAGAAGHHLPARLRRGGRAQRKRQHAGLPVPHGEGLRPARRGSRIRPGRRHDAG